MRQGMILKQKPQECAGKKRTEQGILQRWQPVSKQERDLKEDDICYDGILYSLGFDLSAFFQESGRADGRTGSGSALGSLRNTPDRKEVASVRHRERIKMNQKSFATTGKPLAGYLLGGLLAGLLLFGGGIFSGSSASAGELDPVQNSVISTDLFLSWIGNQQKPLGLTPDQVRELRDIRVDFKLKSQDLGREMGRIAGSLSQEVGTYPIPLDKVKPSIRRLSDLRGELTLSAISSLARVQGILKKSQWEKARTSWSTHLATSRSKDSAPSSKNPDKK